MFTAADVALWRPEDALQELKSQLPLGWRLTLRSERGYAVAELLDASGDRAWLSANPDPKLLYLEGLGWLMTRGHKARHPAWRVREREIPMRVPNPVTQGPEVPDLDPEEVAAVYKARR